MKLLDPRGLREDTFTRINDDDALPSQGHVLMPLSRAASDGEAVVARGDKLGLLVPNTIRPSDMLAWVSRIQLIVISFPTFSDGRGFSVARLFRRVGYSGTLRASGPLIADQFAFADACGFDEIEIPDEVFARQPLAQWIRARSVFSHGYQRGYGAPASNILERRKTARIQEG